MWDIRTGKPLLVYTEHSKEAMCVGIAADGKTAITGFSDDTLRYSYLMSDGVLCVRTLVLTSIVWVLVDGY